MADLCTNTRRKCQGFRRGPQFGLWMWCIVLKCFICLPCIFSKCLGVNISVAVYPDTMIKLRYGQPLEIFCVAENYTAENLEFHLGRKVIESEKVNATTRRLYIEHLDKQVYTFYCRNNVTNKQCTSRVLVEDSPANVTDFSCISKNLDELNCTWTSPEIYIITKYRLSFNIYGNTFEPCEAKHVGKLRYCSWSTTSQPRYKQMETHYYFNLSSCNYFGCIEQNFTIDHFSVVKPDAPEQLKVLKFDPHNVLLQWKIPNNMYDFLPCAVVHRIEYQIAKIDNTAYFRSVDATMLPPKNKTYTFLLSNLPYAHMSYEVRIYIKSELATEDKFWSDFTYVLFTTASERPQRPPDTIAGAFVQSIYEKYRVIYVYWKQLEEYEEAGANFTYKVVASTGSNNPQTLLPDKNKSLSYVELDRATLDAIDITIWSTNAIGSSVNSSHLYIPSKYDSKVLSVSSFTKLAYENGTYKLSWVGVKEIDNYTLFWCQHNTSQICTGRMNFTVLDPNQNNHVIDLPRDSRYQFAISANSGCKTSGMTWASCDISKDGIPMYGFPVKVHHDAPGKTFVQITWTMSCTLQEGIIKGYLITYCPVLNTSNVCDTTYENKSTYYVANPKQKEINITDLKPYTTYLFTLALNTTYGLKTIENASTGVTTIEDTPTSPRNVRIADVQSDSLIISWDPPLHKNGIIAKYVIEDAKGLLKVDKMVDKMTDKDKNSARIYMTLTGLQAYHNYTLAVSACNAAIRSCSKPSPDYGIFVRTRIGSPSMLKPPTIKNKPDSLTWEPPINPGGSVDLYQIKRVKDENTNRDEIINTTSLSYSLIHCEGVDESETYQVRAVNFDEDPYYGILADRPEVALPLKQNRKFLEYPGPWSPPASVACRSKEGLTMLVILIIIFALIGIMYGSIKVYKKYRKMEDIKPVLPSGLGIPEKDISKYAFGGWNPTNKDEKPSSDEMLLLPNSRTTVSTPETKQNSENNCGSSDHTDSTALSDTSRGAIERQASTSDDGSDSSLHLEVEPVRTDDNNATQDEDSSNSETDNSRENSPYFSDKSFKKNPSGYVQPVTPVVNPVSGYVQSAPAPQTSPLAKPASQPTSSSYVMAALAPPIFTTGVAPPSVPSQPPASSGYVMPEDAQTKSMMNFPKLGPSPTKVFGSESLPIMPTLPQPVKSGADSSYIQLQSLDALPSHKQPARNTVPLKPPTSNGYVSPGDAVINKHLNNMLSGGQLEESAILDPTMSPDAYCRFSWSTDPANDNLHSLLADSHTLNLSKN